MLPRCRFQDKEGRRPTRDGKGERNLVPRALARERHSPSEDSSPLTRQGRVIFRAGSVLIDRTRLSRDRSQILLKIIHFDQSTVHVRVVSPKLHFGAVERVHSLRKNLIILFGNVYLAFGVITSDTPKEIIDFFYKTP